MHFFPAWASFRQFAPPLGLLLLACVPTVAGQEKLVEDWVLVHAHGIAALNMFLSSMACEAHVLSVWPFSCPFQLVSSQRERTMRLWTLYLTVFSFCSFCGVQGLITFYPENYGDCPDDPEQHCEDNPLRVPVKVCSFFLEVGTGCLMLGTHLVIWWFCRERHLADDYFMDTVTMQNLARSSDTLPGEDALADFGSEPLLSAPGEPGMQGGVELAPRGA